MDVQALIDELNQADEHTRLEAKSSQELGASLLQTICAFANEPGLGGGVVLLGVEQDGEGRYVPVGVPAPDKVCADVASACATTFNATLRPRLETRLIAGKAVVVVEVEEAPTGLKPVYFLKQGLPQGAFRRVGSSDQRMVDEDLAAMFAERGGRAFDTTVVPGARRDDLDPAAIAEYRRLRRNLSPHAIELSWDDDELLEAIGALTREGGQLVPTVAGLVVFGRPPALRRLFPMLRADYIRTYGTEWVAAGDARFEAQEFRLPGILLVRTLVNTIVEGMLRRVVVGAGALERREIPLLPEEVIREAVVNALMHRSYRRQDPLMIIRYFNRLEIRNAGTSLKHEDTFGTPGSVPRNPAIAAIFHDTGLAETKGSGIRVMRQQMDAAGLAKPTLIPDRRDDRFTATFLFHHFLDREDLAWLAPFESLDLTMPERAALIIVREIGAINNLALRQVGGFEPGAASTALRRLKGLGLLEAFGRGPGTYYRPAGLLAELAEAKPESATLSQDLPPLSQDLPPLSQDLPP
ncbi:MAG: ATP-binding protein, partial [Candidatus Sericytochromatia bacterium]|nr:ATP-binding protein [Candidatus Sericytochromatia bacterium]